MILLILKVIIYYAIVVVGANATIHWAIANNRETAEKFYVAAKERGLSISKIAWRICLFPLSAIVLFALGIFVAFLLLIKNLRSK